MVRTLRALQDEIRALRGEHVRRDLYEAHRATVASDIARLDKAIEQAEADRKRVTLALVTAGISLLAQFIVMLVK